QSGHIIMSKFATTGDGILTAIKLAEAVVASKLTLGKLASPVKMLPQVLKNVRVADKAAVRECAAVQAKIGEVRETLGKTGRILLRESGTEPVVRVMVEGPTEEICERHVDAVIEVIRANGLA
ncbi:MAG: phosphoglucosamine mutase, partial [Clostridia bacterium]|nr:phosphoglucosamine mutase [Clostridia bacterium]